MYLPSIARFRMGSTFRVIFEPLQRHRLDWLIKRASGLQGWRPQTVVCGHQDLRISGASIQALATQIEAGLLGRLRNAQAKGKRLGWPRVNVDAARVATLRAQGCGWKKIATKLGVGVGTLLRAAQSAR